MLAECEYGRSIQERRAERPGGFFFLVMKTWDILEEREFFIFHSEYWMQRF